MDMGESAGTAAFWAQEEFGQANLGDARRTKRLVTMAASAAQFPSGKLTDVFQESADRQGAYKFVESDAIEANAISKAAGVSCAKRCMNEPFVYVAVDGTSVRVTDRAGTKDYGAVGSFTHGARGIQVVTAFAIDPVGVPIGVMSMQWWNRLEKVSVSCKKRTYDEKELRYWGQAIHDTCEQMKQEAPTCRPWFLLDREGDALDLLHLLQATEDYYTVRAKYNRRVKTESAYRRYVFDKLAPKSMRKGAYKLRVSKTHGRSARKARMNIHKAHVTLLLKDQQTNITREFPVNAIYVREASKVPAGEERIEWLLYTNHPIETLEDTLLVVQGYMHRWRIEELFRTWKSGACSVESTQLQTTNSIKVWATMLVSIAARIERLKYLAREKPHLPATEEFANHEIEALTLLKSKRKKKNETIPDGIPTIATAVLWVAEIGGYVGKSSGGPPGSTTIRRGFERLLPAAEMLRILREKGVTK